VFREDLKVTQCQLKVNPSTFEFAAVRLAVGCQRFLIANIYRPPGTSITTFFDEISDLTDAMSSMGGHPILMGDFNCPGDCPNKVDTRLATLISCYNMCIVNKDPTRLNHDGAMSMLDVIIEPECDRRLQAVKTLQTGFSDHSMVMAQLICSRYKKPLITYSFRNFRKLNVDEFKKFIRNSVSYTTPADDADKQAALLNADLRKAIDQFAPLCTRTRRESKPETRWLSPEAREAKRVRRRLERRYTVTKSDSDRRAYRAACRSAHSLITQSLSNHVCSEVLNVADNPRLLWRMVNHLLHPCAGGNWYQDLNTHKLAEELCMFFVDKVQRVKETIRSKLYQTQLPPVSVLSHPLAAVMSTFRPVSVAEVNKAILASPNKTSPMDIIPITLLKRCSEELAVPICHLVNVSFSQGSFPSIFKTGLVTPLLKKPGLSTSDSKNFRPITNLSTISKVMERMALTQLKSAIVSSPNFCPHQSAYRTAHSTETALIKIVNDVISSIDKGTVVGLVGLDISAAFDTVNHELLLNRLASDFGIDGTCLNWIGSYLQDRCYSVRVGQSTSSTVPLAASGVPQGSVLGPILFTAYVSPIGRLIQDRGIGYHCYADDTQLYTSLTAPAAVGLARLEDCTSVLQRWFWQNDLLLNPEKSEAIYFGTRQRLHSQSPTLTVADCQISTTGTLKTLGVTLDSTLSFGPHIDNVVRACNFHLRGFRQIRRSLPQHVANTIACSIVSTRLDYCNSLLYNISSTSLHKLQRVQNNLARVVSGVNRFQRPSEILLHDLHWLPVEQRIVFKLATLTYRAVQQHQPPYLASLLCNYTPSRSLRSSSQALLNKPSSRTVLGTRRFASAAPTVWNGLPINVRTADSIRSFKTRLKTFLFPAISP